MARLNIRSRSARAGLAAAAVFGVVIAGAPMPASAQIISICSGIAGPVTVPGDLIVRADEWCILEGTTVDGNVIVRRGADFVATDATLNGRVTAHPDGYVDLTNTTVADRIVLRSGYGLLAVDSELGGHVIVRDVDPTLPSPAVLSIGSTIDGRISADTGAVWIGDSRVTGDVAGTGVDYVDLINTVAEGGLQVTSAGIGSIVCDSEVYGPVAYTDNTGPVQLGGDTVIAGCLGANYWHGDVTINGTEGDLLVFDNIMRLGLTGDGNAPAPAGDGNRVRGETGGQFSDLESPAVLRRGGPSLSGDRAAQVRERGANLQDQLEQRRDEAVQHATVVGDAGL